MNREEVLNELVETLERWPRSTGDHDGCDGWSWVTCSGEIEYRHPARVPIIEQDWLYAKTRQIPEGTERIYSAGDAKVFMKLTPDFEIQTYSSGAWGVPPDQHHTAKLWDQASLIAAPPVSSIPESAERVTFVKGEVIYLKNEGHKIKQFKNGEWFNDLSLDEAVRLWDQAEPVHQPKQDATREEALQFLVDVVSDWPTKTEGTNFPMFWSWLTIGHLVVLSHPIHKNITEQDWERAKVAPTNDAVHQPKHYGVLDGVESIQIIASSMTRDEWRGFCMGNIMKYRMRAGKKDALQQDIDKANEYEMLFDKYKELNRAKR